MQFVLPPRLGSSPSGRNRIIRISTTPKMISSPAAHLQVLLAPHRLGEQALEPLLLELVVQDRA